MNLKSFLPLAVFLSVTLAASAQEPPAWHAHKWSIGGGAELNQGSKTGWAQGYAVTLDRRLFDRRFAAGLRASMDSDYRTVSAFGGLATLRLYPLTFGPGGVFAEFGFGAASWREDDRTEITPVTDWSAGFRCLFLGGFYAEAYVRSGFPSQWAFGLLAGHSFTF